MFSPPDKSAIVRASLYGLEERVPTFSFSVQGMHPRRVAEMLDEAGIYIWDGNIYAKEGTAIR